MLFRSSVSSVASLGVRPVREYQTFCRVLDVLFLPLRYLAASGPDSAIVKSCWAASMPG